MKYIFGDMGSNAHGISYPLKRFLAYIAALHGSLIYC